MIKRAERTNFVWAGIAVFLLVCLDQWTKYLAVRYLKEAEPIVIIRQVFELFYLENRGAAFGIFQNQRWIFLVLTAVTMVLLLWFYKRLPVDRRYLPLRICVVSIFAGAVGNMIDRIKNGYVVDFFYFKWIDFPVFNVADIYVTVSVIAALLLSFFYYTEEEMQEWRGR
ncbi:MAG: signal peptidase II [Lachnospiraceae bacterium]|nr:signal peptidase II [Lachnospiraceae bacterium]